MRKKEEIPFFHISLEENARCFLVKAKGGNDSRRDYEGKLDDK